LWEVVAARLSTAGVEVPAGGRQRVVAVLCEALNVNPDRVAPLSRLYANLGMLSGVE
jgi:hypothetical protein